MITQKSNLSICGGDHDVVTLSRVKATKTPETTYRSKLRKDGTQSVSHQCIPHIEMIDRLRGELTRRDFQIQGECHNLAHNRKSGTRVIVISVCSKSVMACVKETMKGQPL